MASSYKYLSDHDRVVMSNNLDADVLTEQNYDVPDEQWKTDINSPYYFRQYASGSADDTFATSKRVFDITFGRSSETTYDSGSDTDTISYHKAKQAIYNQLAKVLLGYNQDGSIKKFNLDPDSSIGGRVLHNAYFLNLCRSQFVDKVKPGTFSLKINVNKNSSQNNTFINLKDIDSSSNSSIRTCESGQYGLLYRSGQGIDTNSYTIQGLIFYEAGIVVISPYIFSRYVNNIANPSNTNINILANNMGILNCADGNEPVSYINLDKKINNLILDKLSNLGVEENPKQQYLFDMLADRVYELKYQSTTELNSTIYFCRAYNHEFNYSSNPTYLQDSEIIVKGGDPDSQPRAYITSVGLYSDDNQLLAVAKLSEPVLKTPENELIARVRLDF